ncbi:MAG: CoA transferase subunit A [Reyranella sp.]|uniref:CoA transferase subunit A n=1 Tax=Reyranella sp. TaxID=1929291 RepID=UPI003D14A1AB
MATTKHSKPRSSKIVDLDSALSAVEDGMTVGIGGWIFHGQPMALIRGLVRRGARDLKLVPAPGSVAPDMLIGAGCVRETACVFISFEHLGLAPNFRRAAQSGALKVLEMDGPGIGGGLRAGACDLPYGLVPDLGTDLPTVNPQGYRKARIQDGGRPLLEVPAIRPDIVLLHGQQADEEGNVQYFGAGYFDLLMAQAAKHVICSVDRIVPASTVRQSARLTKIPSAFVHAVVVTPFGAHPGCSPGLYVQDEKHFAAYIAASRDQTSFDAYLADHARLAGGEAAYLERIGANALAALSAGGAAP